MDQRRSNFPAPVSRLSVFLLASLCGHVVLVLSWISAPRFASEPESIISVSLVAPASMPLAPRSLAAQRQATFTKNSVEAAPAQDFAPARAAPEPDSAPTHFPDGSTAADTRAAQQESDRARVQASLLTDLKRYFVYPLLAQRQGWQGTVLISFTVQPDGVLERVQIAQSSGYEVLDKSAVTAVQRVGHLNESQLWRGGVALEMKLPVIYRLVDR